MQNGQGNQSRHDSPNRQFDRSNWTGPVATDGAHAAYDAYDAYDAHDAYDARDARDAHDAHDARSRHNDANRPANQPANQPANLLPNQPDEQHLQTPRDLPGPFTQNNRRGTHALLSPSLVYAARNRGGRLLSPRVADATAAMLAQSPLVRFSLHPPDARYPELIRHIQQVLERLLERREAITKAECARRLARSVTSMDPTSRPASDPDPSRSSPDPVHSAADRTSPPD
jgi:hypothetical protein